MASETAAAAAARLRQVADSLSRLSYEAWHFGDSVAFEGMLTASKALTEERYAAFAQGFVRGWAATKDGFQPLDCTAPGRAMMHLGRDRADDLVVQTATALAEYLLTRRQLHGVFATWQESPLRPPYGGADLTSADAALLADPGPGVFVDCLHFDPPFFAALAEATADRAWADVAVGQARGYVDLLQDPDTGLFFHFHLAHSGRAHMLGWARGQGWALLGLLDVVESCPDHPGTEALRRAAGTLVAAMAASQRIDGHWYAVAGEPRSGDETSTAAFMAAGFARALRLLDLPEPDRVRAAAAAALRATVTSLNDRGVLTGVSAAVWASTVDSHYWHVPRGFTVPWGQGPAVLALAEADEFAREPVGLTGPPP